MAVTGLNEKGIQQALAIRNAVADLPIKAICCSPMLGQTDEGHYCRKFGC